MHRHAFLFNSLLVCLLTAPAWGQQTVEGMKVPPSCQVQLTSCKNTLTSTQGQLATCKNTVKNTKKTLALCANDLEECQTDLDACEAEPRGSLPGDGYWNTPEEQAIGINHEPKLSYTDHGDGTITDNNTRLMWEKKEYMPGSIHHVYNTYQWTSTIPYGHPAPDGSLFTVFLVTLNTAPCFAGYCDWRLPNIQELQSIVDHAWALPATNLPGLRNTTPANYWSSTTLSLGEGYAWIVLFENGATYWDGKQQSNHAIAVRGGQG